MHRSIFTILTLSAIGIGLQGCSSNRVASQQAPDDMYYSGSSAPVRTTVTETTRTTTTEYVDQTPPSQQQAQNTAPDYYQPGASNTTTSTDQGPAHVTNNYYGDVYNSPGSAVGYTSPLGFYRPWYRPGMTVGFAYSSWSGFSPMIGFSYGYPHYYDPFWYTPPPPVVYSPWYNPYWGWGYNPYMAYYSPWYGGGFYDPYYYGYSRGYYAGYYSNSYYRNNYYPEPDNGGRPLPPRTAVLSNAVSRAGGTPVRNATGNSRNPGVTPGGSYTRNPNQTAVNPSGGRPVDNGGRTVENSGGRIGDQAPAKGVSGREVTPATPKTSGRTYQEPSSQTQRPARELNPRQQPVERRVDVERAPVQQPNTPRQVPANEPVERNYYSRPRQAPQQQQQQQPVRENNYYEKSRQSEYRQPASPNPQSRWGSRTEQPSRQVQQAPAYDGGSWGGRSSGGSNSGGSRSGGSFGSSGGSSNRPR